jgi:hypothetical protein
MGEWANEGMSECGGRSLNPEAGGACLEAKAELGTFEPGAAESRYHSPIHSFTHSLIA